MKVYEVKEVLNDPKMANKNTNFKIVEKHKPGSNKPGNPTNKDLILKISESVLKLSKKLDSFIVKQEKFNKQTNKKFEIIFDIFKRNNLE